MTFRYNYDCAQCNHRRPKNFQEMELPSRYCDMNIVGNRGKCECDCYKTWGSDSLVDPKLRTYVDHRPNT